MGYDIVSDEAIDNGKATDAYFQRTRQALEYADKNPVVVAEVTESQLPNGTFRALGGLKDVAELFEGKPVDIDALPEGTFFDGGPVLRITGRYLDFAELETALLGFLSQASSFLSAAVEVRSAAPETPVMSFGARHLNPALGQVLERNAVIAGLDGFSFVAAEETLGREASGTMPHALIIPFGRGNQEEAWMAFNESVPEEVPRIALVDTFTDEVDEAVRAAKALDGDLEGVRLDTTSSRRGKFDQIIREVRWELNMEGYEDVDIFVSGGITVDAIYELRDIVDGFGIGSYISDASPLDFGLDVIEIDGEPIAKRGKYPGVKAVYRDGSDHRVQLAEKEAPESWEPLLEPLLRDGEIVRDFGVDEASEHVAQQLEMMDDVAVQRKN